MAALQPTTSSNSLLSDRLPWRGRAPARGARNSRGCRSRTTHTGFADFDPAAGTDLIFGDATFLSR